MYIYVYITCYVIGMLCLSKQLSVAHCVCLFFFIISISEMLHCE